MVFYYCSVHAGYQKLYCSKDYDETSKILHDSEGGTESEIVIYEAQSIFSQKFAEVWKKILMQFYCPFLTIQDGLFKSVSMIWWFENIHDPSAKQWTDLGLAGWGRGGDLHKQDFLKQ